MWEKTCRRDTILFDDLNNIGDVKYNVHEKVNSYSCWKCLYNVRSRNIKAPKLHENCNEQSLGLCT